MFKIIEKAQEYRKDTDIFDHNKAHDLYRGAGMTLQEIKEFKDLVIDEDKYFGPIQIQLFGYTSCSLQKNQALSFAWENQDSGHHKVLFHI